MLIKMEGKLIICGYTAELEITLNKQLNSVFTSVVFIIQFITYFEIINWRTDFVLVNEITANFATSLGL